MKTKSVELSKCCKANLKVEEWRFKSLKYLDLIQSGAEIEALEKYLEETKG